MKQRLEYIDAARGLAMFTVVYSHICLFCIPEYHASSAIIDFLRTYFLNGFFFISGILAYRSDCKFSELLSLLGKRLYQLLIPAIIVGLIYALTHHITVRTFFCSDVKCGYWFTISLFEMFTIYYLFTCLVNKICNTHLSTFIFTLLCFGIYFVFKSYPLQQSINKLLCWGNTSFYIPLFALGISFSAFKSNALSRLHKIGGGVNCSLLYSLSLVSLFISPFHYYFNE